MRNLLLVLYTLLSICGPILAEEGKVQACAVAGKCGSAVAAVMDSTTKVESAPVPTRELKYDTDGHPYLIVRDNEPVADGVWYVREEAQETVQTRTVQVEQTAHETYVDVQGKLVRLVKEGEAAPIGVNYIHERDLPASDCPTCKPKLVQTSTDVKEAMPTKVVPAIFKPQSSTVPVTHTVETVTVQSYSETHTYTETRTAIPNSKHPETRRVFSYDGDWRSFDPAEVSCQLGH